MTRRRGDAVTRRCKYLTGGLSPRLRVSVSPCLCLLALGLAMIAAAQGVEPPFNLTDPTFIARGRALFNERCAGRCHGPDGREGMEAPILTGKTHLTPWFVYNTLVTGRPGTAMPSWVDRFSHEELWQLTAFVTSLGNQARSGSQ